jgi:hypothetical protein
VTVCEHSLLLFAGQICTTCGLREKETFYIHNIYGNCKFENLHLSVNRLLSVLDTGCSSTLWQGADYSGRLVCVL